MRTIEQMMQQEIDCCMSSLVSTLASGYGDLGDLNKPFRELCEQAFELASPVPDYEEAAIQAGWFLDPADNLWTAEDHSYTGVGYGSAQELCANVGLESIDSEVFEHWAVSTWLAEKLIEQGEKVDTDFAGLNVWARTTTGQQISADGVIERIYAAMMAA